MSTFLLKVKKLMRGQFVRSGLLFLMALVCLVVYVLACKDSPISFSKNGRYIAFWAVSSEGEVIPALFVHDLKTRQTRIIKKYLDDDGEKFNDDIAVSGPCFSPYGKWIAYSLMEKVDRKDGQTSTQPYTEIPAGNVISKTTTRPKGKPVKFSVIIISVDGKVEKQIYSQTLPLLVDGEIPSGYHTFWSPDGRFIYARGPSCWVRVDTKTGKGKVLGITVGAADLSADGKYFAMAGSNGELCVWDISAAKWFYYPHTCRIYERAEPAWMKFSPKGDKIACPFANKIKERYQIKIVNLKTQKTTVVDVSLPPQLSRIPGANIIPVSLQWATNNRLRMLMTFVEEPSPGDHDIAPGLSILEYDMHASSWSIVRNFPLARYARSFVCYDKSLWVARMITSESEWFHSLEIHNHGTIYTIDTMLPLIKALSATTQPSDLPKFHPPSPSWPTLASCMFSKDGRYLAIAIWHGWDVDEPYFDFNQAKFVICLHDLKNKTTKILAHHNNAIPVFPIWSLDGQNIIYGCLSYPAKEIDKDNIITEAKLQKVIYEGTVLMPGPLSDFVKRQIASLLTYTDTKLNCQLQLLTVPTDDKTPTTRKSDESTLVPFKPDPELLSIFTSSLVANPSCLKTNLSNIGLILGFGDKYILPGNVLAVANPDINGLFAIWPDQSLMRYDGVTDSWQMQRLKLALLSSSGWPVLSPDKTKLAIPTSDPQASVILIDIKTGNQKAIQLSTTHTMPTQTQPAEKLSVHSLNWLGPNKFRLLMSDKESNTYAVDTDLSGKVIRQMKLGYAEAIAVHDKNLWAVQLRSGLAGVPSFRIYNGKKTYLIDGKKILKQAFPNMKFQRIWPNWQLATTQVSNR